MTIDRWDTYLHVCDFHSSSAIPFSERGDHFRTYVTHLTLYIDLNISYVSTTEPNLT